METCHWLDMSCCISISSLAYLLISLAGCGSDSTVRLDSSMLNYNFTVLETPPTATVTCKRGAEKGKEKDCPSTMKRGGSEDAKVERNSLR